MQRRQRPRLEVAGAMGEHDHRSHPGTMMGTLSGTVGDRALRRRLEQRAAQQRARLQVQATTPATRQSGGGAQLITAALAQLEPLMESMRSAGHQAEAAACDSLRVALGQMRSAGSRQEVITVAQTAASLGVDLVRLVMASMPAVTLLLATLAVVDAVATAIRNLGTLLDHLGFHDAGNAYDRSIVANPGFQALYAAFESLNGFVVSAMAAEAAKDAVGDAVGGAVDTAGHAVDDAASAAQTTVEHGLQAGEDAFHHLFG